MTLEQTNRQLHDQQLVNRIYYDNNFDFVGLALQSSRAPHNIKWVFVAGNQNEKFRNIVLRSGIGIAGLVIRTGKPFWDNHLQAATFASEQYSPIAKCESLVSAAAVPVFSPETHLVSGVLLAGYRTDHLVSDETADHLSRYL